MLLVLILNDVMKYVTICETGWREKNAMAVISMFYGIIISMYYFDRNYALPVSPLIYGLFQIEFLKILITSSVPAICS